MFEDQPNLYLLAAAPDLNLIFPKLIKQKNTNKTPSSMYSRKTECEETQGRKMSVCRRQLEVDSNFQGNFDFPIEAISAREKVSLWLWDAWEREKAAEWIDFTQKEKINEVVK